MYNIFLKRMPHMGMGRSMGIGLGMGKGMGIGMGMGMVIYNIFFKRMPHNHLSSILYSVVRMLRYIFIFTHSVLYSLIFGL